MKFDIIHLKRLLKAGATALCVLGFAWLVWEHVEKFINKKTGVAISYRRSKFHKFPDVAFCPGKPFESNMTWSDLLTGEAYETHVRTAQVGFYGSQKNEYGAPKVAHFEWRNVSTIYNGRCRQFKFGAELETGDYMVFFLKYDQHPVDLFFFNGGEEVFLLWQNWGFSSMQTLSVNASTVLRLSPQTFRYLEGDASGGLDCQGEESSLTNCLSRVQERVLGGFDCLPMPVLQATNLRGKKVCQSGQEKVSRLALQASSDALAQSDRYCKVSCVLTWHDIMAIPGEDIPGSPYFRPNGYFVFVHFPTTLVTEHEQYFIHDFVSIVSAVGGGLGLFLGFSCFSIASRLTMMLQRRVGKRRNDNKHKEGEEEEEEEAPVKEREEV